MKRSLCFFSILFASFCFGQRVILEDDNIAVAQRESPVFTLPAPGLRFRTGNRRRVQSQQLRYDVAPSNNIGNFVGQLLPEEPGEVMPTITTLDVQCSPEYMTVQIGFDNSFNGVIYSKGYFGNSDCTYFSPGRGQRVITFQVLGEGCGTQYIEPPGEAAFMENVIIIQNEPGIQEIWDTARGLRCLFDGSAESRSRQTVSAALNVAMLDQQIVSFSSDAKASASMDIQVGRGPFAPSASGLVKIGELMTMVVSAEGPKQVDLLVRQCVAHDGSNDNLIELTDVNGCVLKKKIIGSWQKKTNNGNGESPVVSYAHFQAFKFPDKMDVYIECEVDLCNGACPVCEEDQVGHNKRRRSLPRSVEANPSLKFEEAVDEAELIRDRIPSENQVPHFDNKSENAILKLARKLRVLSPDDISVNGDQFSSITLITKTSSENSTEDLCMSVASFISGIIVMLIILVASSAMTAVLCIRVRTIPSASSSFPPDSSFHAFSTISGKNT